MYSVIYIYQVAFTFTIRFICRTCLCCHLFKSTCLDISERFFALLISQPGPDYPWKYIFLKIFPLNFALFKKFFPWKNYKTSFVNDWLLGSHMPNVVSSFLTVMIFTSFTLVAFKVTPNLRGATFCRMFIFRSN